MGNYQSHNPRAGHGTQPYHAGHVRSSIGQRRTNGKSLLGTLAAAALPAFLSNNPLPNGYPWSHLSPNTDYYHEVPYTGVIRCYDFTISRDVIAPDGYLKPVLLVNGGFPGPLIEANWGDTIQVTVRNNITSPEEGTALHWHGFLQKGTPWEDGVPAVTQCPIAPGKEFTYTFQADMYGTTWYHSHYSAQYAGGLIGPMVIHGPQIAEYDIDLGPVMLTDWYHEDYFTLVEQTMAVNSTPVFADNNLINGKMNFDCASAKHGDRAPCVNDAGVSQFRFEKGKKHLLRLINAGAEALQHFSIDGHTMTVIANDFVPVQPYETKVVTLGIGQRSDVIVEANGELDAYYMRSNISKICSLARNHDALAVIYYDDADTYSEPKSEAWDIQDPGTCANDDLEMTVPFKELALPEPDLTYDMEVKLFVNGSGIKLWSLDGVTFRGNYNSPPLLLGILGNYTFDEEWNVRRTGNARSVRVNVINHTPVAHPMHLHGFDMYVLHEGLGPWDGTIVRPSNPQRRDVFQVRPNGHLVMQFDAGENPGVWPFHCHIAWHVSAGFFVQFLTGEDKVRGMKIPAVVAETCREWAAWTGENIPEQIDSGL
ncbi:ascorbase and Cu-oxidase [Emericellopsis atlantica]|uniref:Ascorbase and Cu-oxidase n=1 Tax=Emericellopsis atlantica TaxID=2614577 RepID=A0A9P7ZFW2_9HYPO|nr:ascorbase and Cu-oxidase [Emericellopsis atlantica]KAG9251363.1 ascorbase and Cu-oxidase [Emericellopsis atlantica]